MRRVGVFVLAAFLLSPGLAAAQEAPETGYQPVGTISEVMIDIVYPLSDEFFYIMREPPDTEYEWTLLRRSGLTLAEAGNLLMMPGRAIQQEDWFTHAKRLVEVATRAYEAAEAHDLDAIVALSPDLETSCRACHEQYHPRYGRRRQNPDN